MRHFTILNAGSRQFLISADSDFVEVEQELSIYWFNNKSFWQIIHEREKDYVTFICFLIEMGVATTDGHLETFWKKEFCENKFPELWVTIVNKIVPNANIKFETYSPMGWRNV